MNNKLSNTIQSLVFEGGGIRGFAFLGTLKFLEEKNILQNIKHVIGSSAGCIYALGIACKINTDTMTKIINEKDFSTLKDDSYGYLLDTVRVINYYGMCKGDALLCWYHDILSKFAGNPNITFEELYKKTNIELVITGTNLNKKRTEYFSYKNTPTMQIALAMRISTSIPLFFKAVIMNGDIYVDGGVLSNYPIAYFDGFKDENKTLGLKLMSFDEMVIDGNIEYKRNNISNIKDYTEVLIEAMLCQIEKVYIKKSDWNRSIVINTGKIESTNFNISKKEINTLIEEGYNSAQNYFK